MSDFTMTIAGSAVGSTETFDVVNPATGKVHDVAPRCTPAQLDDAFTSAREALPGWRADPEARRDALRAAADALRAATPGELPLTVTLEQGKPLREARMEVLGGAAWLRYFADLPMPRTVIQDDERGFVEVARRPMGVVAAITPWNFPVFLACSKIAPALVAGNTVVLKPSPFTPLSSLLMGRILRDILPPGVLNVVSGTDELGVLMSSHPTPRKITLTGSVETGKEVAAASARTLRRVTLELGGNDAAIVLDDVEPATVASALFEGAFRNNGQVCSAVKRVYVPRARHAALVDALAAEADAATVGSGLDEHVRLGPVGTEPQYKRVRDLVADALRRGARAAAGGGRPVDGPGYFLRPTVLADAEDGMRIVDEEQFGPALPVIPYDDVEDALTRANASFFGLGGSVWSADEERATAVAERLECGTAWVNTHGAAGPHQPVGGVKWSGVGLENGTWGLEGVTEPQVVHRARR
jgi:acyl-CoA reductase-like NAD-dependent aldehyde dehydrogenase